MKDKHTRSVNPAPVSGAEGSPFGAFEHPMDKPPKEYVPSKGKQATEMGLEGCEEAPGQENEGSLAKRFM